MAMVRIVGMNLMNLLNAMSNPSTFGDIQVGVLMNWVVFLSARRKSNVLILADCINVIC